MECADLSALFSPRPAPAQPVFERVRRATPKAGMARQVARSQSGDESPHSIVDTLPGSGAPSSRVHEAGLGARHDKDARHARRDECCFRTRRLPSRRIAIL